MNRNTHNTSGAGGPNRSMETSHKPLVILRCKVVVVGDACVGKTALTQVFNTGGSSYPKSYMMVVFKHTYIIVDICMGCVNRLLEPNSA